MVVRLSGATSLRDSKCSNLLAQWMSLSPFLRTHGHRRDEEAAGGESEGEPRPGGMLSIRCCSRSYCVHNLAFIKPKLPSKMICESIYELMNYQPVV